MSTHTTTPAHTLTFEVPTTRDYLNGGFGDLVAQCSCGAFEYVYSRREGAYWHGLHRSQPTRNPHYLMVNAPMPEGWEEAPALVAAARVLQVAARVYTCARCVGAGAVEASYATIGGRFYHFGERAACPECAGTGVMDRWVA